MVDVIGTVTSLPPLPASSDLSVDSDPLRTSAETDIPSALGPMPWRRQRTAQYSSRAASSRRSPSSSRNSRTRSFDSSNLRTRHPGSCSNRTPHAVCAGEQLLEFLGRVVDRAWRHAGTRHFRFLLRRHATSLRNVVVGDLGQEPSLPTNVQERQTPPCVVGVGMMLAYFVPVSASHVVELQRSACGLACVVFLDALARPTLRLFGFTLLLCFVEP